MKDYTRWSPRTARLQSVGRAVRRLVGAVSTAGVLAVLPACGSDSTGDSMASAKAALAKRDFRAAVVHLKGVLGAGSDSGELRFLLGRALLAQGDASGALVELTKARELRYGDAQVLPELVKAMLALGQSKKVIDQFAEQTLPDQKATAELKALVAAAHVALGDIDRCRAVVEEALALDAKNISARLLKARLVSGNGHADDGLAIVEAVLADAPTHGGAWSLKGELLASGKHDVDGGIKAYRQALTGEPALISAHAGLIELLLAKNDVPAFKAQIEALGKVAPASVEALFYAVELALVENDLKRAREGAQRLLLLTPNFPPALQVAGVVSLRTDELALAQKQLGQAVQLAPTVPAARRLLAEALLRSGQAGKAVAALQPLLELAAPADVDLAMAAQAYMQEGDLAKAESFYSRAAKANPQDTKSRVALALAQLAKGDAGGGLSQLEALAAQDQTTFADMALINARMLRNDLDGAMQAIDRLEGKVQSKSIPQLLRARVSLKRNDQPSARASLEKALAADPVNFPVLAEMAVLDIAEGRQQDSLKRFEAVLAREPQNVPAALAVADLKQRTGSKPAEVEALLLDIVKRFPGEVAPRLALVQHYLTQRASKTALSAAQDALTAIPDNPRIVDVLARAQLASGDLRQAIVSLQKVAASHGNLPEPHLRLGDVYLGTRDLQAASTSYQRALDVAPRNLAAQRGLVQVALARRRIPDALKIARDVQIQRPGESVGLVMEGDIHVGQEAWVPAIAAYKAALARQPYTDVAKRLHTAYLSAGRQVDADRFAATWEHDSPRDADFGFYLGSLAVQRKDFASAEASFRKVVAVRPADAMAFNNLAALLLQQGKPGALELAEKANQLAPNRSPYLDTLASAQAAEKHLQDAVVSQQKAVALAPEVPAYRLGLAKLLIDAGNRSQAREELQKLSALGSAFSGQAEVSALLKGL